MNEIRNRPTFDRKKDPAGRRGSTGSEIPASSRLLTVLRHVFPAFLAVFALFLFSGCQNLPIIGKKKEEVTDAAYFNAKAKLLVDQLMTNSTKKIRKVALLDLVNTDGRVSQFGRYLTDKTVEIAVAQKSFQTVPRGETTDALVKNNIPYNGSLDRESAKKLGTTLGVDTVVMGQISDLQKGSNVDVSMKAIDTQVGNVISVASVDIARSKQVQSLLTAF